MLHVQQFFSMSRKKGGTGCSGPACARLPRVSHARGGDSKGLRGGGTDPHPAFFVHILALTSILPVTAEPISAVRYSLSRSITVATLAKSASILAVSRSRNAAMVCCFRILHRKSPKSGYSRSSSILFNPFEFPGFGRGDGQVYFAIGSDNRYYVPALSKLNFQGNAYGQTCP
jgi:hypothetical protein